jgi:hypothetical protein
MIKGTKVQMWNSVAITPYSAGLKSAVGLFTVPTGKTFILTDLVCGFTPVDDSADSTTGALGTVPAGVALLDVAFGQAVTAFVAENIKVAVKAHTIRTWGSQTSSSVACAGPCVLTDLVNGPEFSTCVSAGGIGTFTIPARGLYIGGIVR